ncbi:sialidase family protein [Bacteroides sp. 519]|uniref:sialidase family protein n=1 Tax=Bacteroides sp. 519 TaxID=2302937 RepID=UPI0013D36A55|nr:sialidase family protein [Bacteroides sp. 519]NDV58258.1 sialidase [Bacteroides sp. 519]
MKKNISFLILLCCCVFNLAAQDVVQIKQPQIPILVDRQDNVLFYIRLNAESKHKLDEITIDLDGDIRLSDIRSLKLYYGGTESVQKKGSTYYAPVQYLSRNNPLYTRLANQSYSIKKSEVSNITKKVVLKADQKLCKGINYFWVSIEVKPNTPITAVLTAGLTEAKADGKIIAIENNETNITRRMGVGVRYAGDDEVAAYRIPGLVTTNKGTLLGVYDVRYNNGADLQEYVDVGLSRSTDKGQTWEPMRIAMSFGENNGLPRAQNGVGDPAILVDKLTGRVWVIAAWTQGMGNGRAWHNSQQGMDAKTAQLMLVYSDDDGQTWSEPINITNQVKKPEWYFLLQGPGMGITMQDGTLVFAAQFINEDRDPSSCIIYSKDRGKTWHLHNAPRENTTEAQVAEVSPGVLMLNMRDDRGGSRAVYTTKDMGQTWEKHPSSRSVLRESVCMASLIQVNAKDNCLHKDILLFSNPNTTKDRNMITIKASLDGGLSFPTEYQVLLDEDHGWGYSCLTMIDEETVGILYEGSTAHMVFQAVKLKDIIK